MAGVKVELNDFDNLEKWTEQAPDKLRKLLITEARQMSETIAGDARAFCPIGIPLEGTGGNLHDNINGFVSVLNNNEVEGGAVTSVGYASYVEFGTGPTGSKKGHPLDLELGIVRKQGKWKVKIPTIGVRWIAGQEARPFMYPAMKQNEEAILEKFGTKLVEAVNLK